MRLPPAPLCLGLLAVSLAGIARAHDPADSWTMITLFADRLEMDITMAQQNALRLSNAGADAPFLGSDNFATFLPKLKAHAGDLYVVTSVRTPLKPRSLDVMLTEENDITFRLVFPRPAAGRLHFYATFLTTLGDGFGGNIDVTDHTGKDLGWDQISSDRPNFEVTVPAPAPAPPKKSSAVLQPATIRFRDAG